MNTVPIEIYTLNEGTTGEQLMQRSSSSTTSLAKSLVIEENIPASAVSGLGEFIERYYIGAKTRSIKPGSFSKRIEEEGIMFIFSWQERGEEPVAKFGSGSSSLPNNANFTVNLKISQPSVEVSFMGFDPSDKSQLALCSRTLDEVQNVVWSYFQNAKVSSLYFVIGSPKEKHSESPEEAKSAKRNVLRKIFSGNTTNAFMLFLFMSYLLFFVVGNYAVLFLIAIQLIYLVFADRIILNLGNVNPSAQNPLVVIVSVRATQETVKFLKTVGRRILSDIRGQVEQLTVPSNGETRGSLYQIKSAVLEILTRHGIKGASLNDIEVKKKNVYAVVVAVAKKFGKPIPKIVISNSIVSNASATGISPNHSAITITAGALEDLNDEELESVVGHELGHVKGRDPLILFGVTSFVYVSLFFPLFPILQFLGYFYFLIAFAIVFAVGKVLETRADTESAVVLQNAQEMATSLTKIGFRQLFSQKYNPLAKFLDWFKFDPHPPMYFRVARMSKLSGKENTVRHTFLSSLRDCIVGFLSSPL